MSVADATAAGLYTGGLSCRPDDDTGRPLPGTAPPWQGLAPGLPLHSRRDLATVIAGSKRRPIYCIGIL